MATAKKKEKVRITLALSLAEAFELSQLCTDHYDDYGVAPVIYEALEQVGVET